MGPRGLAADQEQSRRLGATLVWLDESCFLTEPCVGDTWSRVGVTPTIEHRMRHREKVTLLGSLTLSPARRRCGLHVDVLRSRSITQEDLIDHLRRLRQTSRTPLVVVLDNLGTHEARRVQHWVDSIGDVHLEFLPPYAPELNAVEPAWSHGKCLTAASRLVEDIDGLEVLAHEAVENAREQRLLRGFIRSTRLPISFELKREHQSEPV